MAFGAKIKLKVNTSGASAFRTEIQNYVNSATSSKPIVIKNITIKLANPKTQLSQIRNQLNQAGGIGSVNLKEINATGAINKLRKDIQYMLSGLNIVGLKEFLGTEGITAAAGDINRAKEAASAWASQLQVVNDISKKLSTSYKGALSGNQMITNSAELTQITAAYTAWQQKVEQLRATKVALSAEELTSLQNEGIAIQQKISLLQREQVEATKAANAKKTDAMDAEAAAKKELALTQQTITLRSQVQRYILSNSKAYKAYGADLDGIMFALRDEANLSDEALKRLKIRFSEIKAEANAAGKSGNTFFDTLKKGWEKFGGWSLVTKTMMTAYRTIKNMVKAVTELDSAMTELKKVTDLSNQSYENYLKKATSMSKEVGASLADTVNATADFARLGYDIDEASSLAEAALVYKNVGDGIEDISEASESLISTIKAFEQFGVSAENAMDIVDKFNEVGNNFAISSQGIGVALQKSASSLAAAGNDLSQSIALITAANAVVQNPEVVGTAMKTVSMYLRAAKTEAEEAGESTDGMANSVSELRKELLRLTKDKVDIMIDDTTFKSTYQIMKDLSEVWSSIADIDKANILELIGGKRNATTVTSLLTNFKDAEAALASANSAVGSATKENEKYLDSIAGKLSVLESKFQSLSNNLIDSNFVKLVLDIASGLMTVLELLSKFPAIMTTIAAITAIIAGKVKSNDLMSLTSRIMMQKNALLSQKAATDELSISLAGLSRRQQKVIMDELQRKVVSNQLTQTEYEQIVATLGLAGAEGTLTATNKTLGASFKSLMASIPVWGWISLGVTAVIELTSAILSFAESSENAEEKLKRLDESWQELSNTIQTSASNFQTLKKDADDIIPKYAELAQGVNEYGENVSLTDDEFAEFVSLNNKLGEMFPELVHGYDSNGNAILGLAGDVDTLTESLYNCVKAQREASAKEIADTMPQLLKDISEYQSTYNDEIEETQNLINKIKSGEDFAWTQGTEYSGFADADAVKEYYDFLDLLKQKGIEVHSEVENIIGTQGMNYTATWDTASNAVKNAIAGYEKEINDLQSRIESKWKALNPVISAWLSTDFMYNDTERIGKEGQSLVSRMIGEIDFSSIGIDLTAEDASSKVQDYIRNNVISPIYDMSDDTKKAFYDILDIEEAAKDGSITAKEYVDKIKDIIQNSNINDNAKKYLKSAFKIDDSDDATLSTSIQKQMAHAKSLLKDEYDDLVDGLSLKDLELIIEIKEKEGSLTFEGLKKKIDEIRNQNITAPIDSWSDLGTVFDAYTEKMQGLATIQKAVTDGFIISADAAREFASTYPEILQYATSAGNGQIKLNADVVNNFLNGKTAELKGSLDAQIAQLEAEKAILEGKRAAAQAQLELAKNVGEGEGQISADVAEYKINAGNIATKVLIENGVQQADAYRLVAASMAGNIDEFNRIAGEVCTDVNGNFNQAAYNAAQAMYNNMNSAKKDIASVATQAWLTADAIAAMPSGDKEGSDKVVGGSGGGKFGSGIKIQLHDGKFDGTNYSFTPQEFSLDEFISDIELDISGYTSRIAEIDGQIAVLQALKNKPIEQFHPDYGKDSGGGDGKDKEKEEKEVEEVEEYIASVEKYTEALQRLQDAERKRAQLERDLENANSASEKVRIQKELNLAYIEEQDALHNLNNLRDETIRNSIPHLQALGFEVEYNDETNRFYIANLEHLNELEADTVGEHENLQEATNALRKDTEELIDDLTTLNEENEEGSQTWLELADSIEEGKEKIIEFIDEVVTEANELVDSFEEVYSTITDAASEYASTGYLGVDTLQSILSLAPKYLKYLYDENGQLVLNEESLQAVIAAKTEDMAAETALAYAKKILIAVQEDDIDTLGTLTQATYNSSEATWGAAYATLGLAKAMGTAKGMDAGYFEDAVGYLTRMQSLTKTATDSIPQYYQSLKNGYTSQADGLSEIISLTQDLIQWETEQKIESLEKEKESYREIIEAKKELLQLSKEQEDHEDDVADKLKEIAKLQSRIDQLSLDDSREAQAEKKQLEEELSELQKDFADSQADYAYNTQIDALDKELEAFEEAKDDEIKEQEEMLDSAEELYQAAVERITENWGDNWEGFYQELLGWNNEYGSTLETELTTAWNAATAAAQRYGSIAAAISGVNNNTNLGSFDDADSIVSSMGQNSISWLTASADERPDLEEANRQLASQYEALTGDTLTPKNGLWYKSNGKPLYEFSTEEVALAIVSAMKENSKAYNSTTDVNRQQDLMHRNEELASLLEERLGETIVRGSNGIWYIGSEGGTQLYRKYHTGGIAGDKSTLEQDEVMAILKEGELVLDESREQALYEIVDFVSSLSERLGKAINVNKLGGIASMLMLSTDTSTAPTSTPSSSNNIEINPSVKVEIHHNGDLDEKDAKRYGNIAAESVLQELNDAFNKRGINSFGGTLK